MNTADRNLPIDNNNPYDYVFKNFDLKDLSALVILKHLNQQVYTDAKGYYNLQPEQIEINFASFSNPDPDLYFPIVQVHQTENDVKLHCRCANPKNRLCEHQAQVLYNILKRDELKIFFDLPLRESKLKVVAKDYGLAQNQNLSSLFTLALFNNKVDIKPKQKSLLAFNAETQLDFERFLPKPRIKVNSVLNQQAQNLILVFSQHKYYSHLQIDLYQAEFTKAGKVKNPINPINTNDLIWKITDINCIQFYNGVLKFQQNYVADINNEIEALKAIVNNPLQLKFYVHDVNTSANINANALKPVDVKYQNLDLQINVDQRDEYFNISGKIYLDNQIYGLDQLEIVYQYFIKLKNELYLINKPEILNLISFFRKHSNQIVLQQTKYAEFEKHILTKLEAQIKINYSYLKAATKKQVEEQGFDLENEKFIYLSESEDFVLITPVMRYGDLEIPVLSKKQIKSKDKLGNLFTLQRDENAELQFIADILKQHLFFYEQETEDSYYLHRKRFLEEHWFLDAFEAWRSKGIHILGFKNLKNNKLSEFKADIDIKVLSGTDWFETKVKVKFGKEKVSLKHLHKSIRNKSRFVSLDDGTQGILPEEWLEKFSAYFNYAEIQGDSLLTHKINYNTIDYLYEDFMLDASAKLELQHFKNKIEGKNSIEDIAVPTQLKADLRPYQKEGLNWLNFLDEFNFGACLADDMGLGKTIQIIAFILSQREKLGKQCDLIVVPASLIYNWQSEIEKFAPSLKVFTLYGAERIKNRLHYDDFDVVLTSYGTLLSDIRFLKEHRFNYVFLDESQNIKNPESQRYKAACLLNSRNRVVITGTPIENNVFDLYGQLSFACPGLLGTKHFFTTVFSAPIDQFKDKKRTQELQQKIKPFILRRTKEQVAKELPDKTEMVLYCEMEAEQREIYEANKKEIQDFITGRNDDELNKSSMHVLKSITRLRQICNSAAILADGKTFAQSSSKINVLLEQIESQVGKHKILIFSQFVTMLDLIKKELLDRDIKFTYLTGQTRNRGEVVESFQNDDSISVFLISLKAGGTGLNLTQADYVYLVDPWWNPAVENQAIDRAHRIGQQKNVMAIRLICPNTIEEKIMKLQLGKKDLVSNLIKSEDGFLKKITKKELLGLLS
jgi:SNF2 family DNA or RNA helicase